MTTRETPPLIIALCLLAAVVLWTGPSHAANPTQAQIQLLNKGAVANSAGRLDEARAHYEAAIDLGELNVARLGLGRAIQKSGGCMDALAQYQKAREAPAVGVPSPQQVEALLDKFTQELRETCPATLVVTCDPPEIRLTLDGAPIACGEPVERPAGSHVLRGELPGGTAQRGVVLVALERTVVTVEITPGTLDPAQGDAIAGASLGGALLGGRVSEGAQGMAAAISAPDAAPIPTPPASAQEVWGWSLVGAGSASLVAGGVLSALVLKNTNDINILSDQDKIDPDRARALRGEGDLLAALQFTGYGLGAALAIVGAALLFTDSPQSSADSPREPSLGLRPVLGPGLWGLGVEIHY